MAWLANLDARARRWPKPLHWTYAATKWLMVALGVYGALGLAYIEVSEGRVGLGTGIASVIVLATIKGIALARSRRPGDLP